MVLGEGLEPPKAEPTDLQSVPLSRSGNLAWSRQQGLNPRPAVYKTAALPAELCRHSFILYSFRIYPRSL